MSQGKREAFARFIHEDSWAHWMKYLFSQCIQTSEGDMLISAEKVERWQRQMNTPYADLPESEKESDRRLADKLLAVEE